MVIVGSALFFAVLMSGGRGGIIFVAGGFLAAFGMYLIWIDFLSQYETPLKSPAALQPISISAVTRASCCSAASRSSLRCVTRSSGALVARPPGRRSPPQHHKLGNARDGLGDPPGLVKMSVCCGRTTISCRSSRQWTVATTSPLAYFTTDEIGVRPSTAQGNGKRRENIARTRDLSQ